MGVCPRAVLSAQINSMIEKFYLGYGAAAVVVRGAQWLAG